jgi:glycosyltransferase involved in cell wall biosynthesis
MNPKVSIGIAFKNPRQYFLLALKSVFAQTFTDWELILIDDGSTDDSLSLAKSLDDPRVRVYTDGESRGLNIRLNQLISLARAPYFFRMDADDIMHSERLEKQYKALLENDENTVIGTSAYSINQDSQIVGLRQAPEHQELGFAARYSFIHPTVAASTDWFRHNLYSTNLLYHRCQDAELWCRTTASTKFINLPEPLLYYRENGVFSFSNYLTAKLVALILIQDQFRHPTYHYIYLFISEICKILLFFIADLLNFNDILVKRRSHTIQSDSLRLASQALDEIFQQDLPLVEVCCK